MPSPAGVVERATPPPVLAERWRLVGRIARGATTEVWWGYDREAGRECAVKLLPPGFARDARVRRAFEAEGERAAAVEHPGLVCVQATGDEDGWCYLVLDNVIGATLSARLRDEGALSAPAARRIAVDLLHALAALHARGIAHGAVTADNVMLTHEGAAVLIDFGAAGPGPSGPDVEAAGTLLLEMLVGRSARIPDDLRHEAVPRDVAAILVRVLGPTPPSATQAAEWIGGEARVTRSRGAGLWLAAAVVVATVGVALACLASG